MKHEGCLGHRHDVWQICQSLMVAKRDCTTLFHSKIENCQLATADAREHVAHAVVVPDFGMLISKTRITSLLRPEARLINPRGVRRDQHPTAGCCDDLVSIEREDTNSSRRSCGLTSIVGSQRFCSVFQYWDFVIGTQFADWIIIRALAIEIDHNNRSRQLACSCTLVESFSKEVGIH